MYLILAALSCRRVGAKEVFLGQVVLPDVLGFGLALALVGGWDAAPGLDVHPALEVRVRVLTTRTRGHVNSKLPLNSLSPDSRN